MIKIAHRQNDPNKDLSKFEGIELDVRYSDHNGEICVKHDLLANGDAPTLRAYFEKYTDLFYAINVKESGISKEIEKLINEYQIKNYFCFDFAVPDLLWTIKNTSLITACRVSEVEGEMFDNAKWVWVDCFNSVWYNQAMIDRVRFSGKKVCLVHPTLHGRDDILGLKADAVCLKERLI